MVTVDPEYVPVGTAAARLGISRVTMRDRVRSGAVPAFRAPRDGRFLLVRLDDVDRLSKPRLVAATREGETSAA